MFTFLVTIKEATFSQQNDPSSKKSKRLSIQKYGIASMNAEISAAKVKRGHPFGL